MYYKITYLNPFDQQDLIYVEANNKAEAVYKAEKQVDICEVIKIEGQNEYDC